MGYVVTHPLAAVEYFLVLLGTPFVGVVVAYSPLADRALVAAAFGLVEVFVALVVIAQGYRSGLLGRNAIWLSLILFAE
jgi:hypothetical protein